MERHRQLPQLTLLSIGRRETMQLVIVVLIGYAFPASSATPFSTVGCDLFSVFKMPKSCRSGTDPFWLMSPDPLQQKPHEVTKWLIHSGEIKVTNSWSVKDDGDEAVAHYRLFCVKYTVSDGEESQVTRVVFRFGDESGNALRKYVCAGITRRSQVAFQVRLSAESTTLSCDTIPLSDTGMTFVRDLSMWNECLRDSLQYEPCPVRGGFTIAGFTNEAGNTECSEPKKGNIRLEGECEPGEGLEFFEGTYFTCIPPLYGDIYMGHSLRCHTKWSDDDYDYAVASAESRVYCVRVARGEAIPREVYLFKDGICDFTSDILHSKKYLKIQLLYQEIPSVCSDVSPWCGEYSENVLAADSMQDFCSGTIGNCRDPTVGQDSIVPTEYRGNWFYETMFTGVDAVEITDLRVIFKQYGRWKFLREANCSRERFGLQQRGKFYFLLSEPERGCRHRVALLWLFSVSPSVILLQISHGEMLRDGVKDLNSNWLCIPHRFIYGETDTIAKGGYFVDNFGWHNIIRPGPQSLVKCNMGQWRTLRVTFSQDTACTLNLQQSGQNGFTATLTNCNRNPAAVEIDIDKPVHYDCLAQYTGENDWVSFLITRAQKLESSLTGRRYLCWLFEDARGLLMPVGDCDDRTMAEVLDEKLKTPLAELSIVQTVVGSGSLPGFSWTLIVLSSFLPSVSILNACLFPIFAHT